MTKKITIKASDITQEVGGAVGFVPRVPVLTTFQADGDVRLHVDTDRNTLVIGYLTIDPVPSDYWDGDVQGELREFSNNTDRDAFVAEKKAEGILALIVDKFDHSGVHYSIKDTANYPDRRWDVAPRGVFVPCKEVRDDYRAGRRTMDDVIADSNTVLDEYSKWCNGEVYGAVVETFAVDPAARIVYSTGTDPDAVWGLIGHDHALQTLSESMSPEDRLHSARADGPSM